MHGKTVIAVTVSIRDTTPVMLLYVRAPGVAAYSDPPAATQLLRVHVIPDNEYPGSHSRIHVFVAGDQTILPCVKVPEHVQAVEPTVEVDPVTHLLHISDA
jgi:hypothetical protein